MNSVSFPLAGERRRKVSTACDSCKRRKYRCTGDSPCYLCQKKGFECTYTIPDRRTLKSERLARARGDESPAPAEVSSSTSPTSSTSPNSSNSSTSSNISSKVRLPSIQTVINNITPTSPTSSSLRRHTLHLLARPKIGKLKRVLSRSNSMSNSNTKDTISQLVDVDHLHVRYVGNGGVESFVADVAPYFNQLFDTKTFSLLALNPIPPPISDTETPKFPDKAQIKVFFDCFNIVNNLYFGAVETDRLFDQIELGKPRDAKDETVLHLVFAIGCFGANINNNGADSSLPYFNHAVRFFELWKHREPCLSTVHVNYMIFIYYDIRGYEFKSLKYIYNTSRLCHKLQLHRKEVNDLFPDSQQRQSLFMNVIYREKMACLGCRYTYSFPDHEWNDQPVFENNVPPANDRVALNQFRIMNILQLLDTALEAYKTFYEGRRFNLDQLLHFLNSLPHLGSYEPNGSAVGHDAVFIVRVFIVTLICRCVLVLEMVTMINPEFPDEITRTASFSQLRDIGLQHAIITVEAIHQKMQLQPNISTHIGMKTSFVSSAWIAFYFHQHVKYKNVNNPQQLMTGIRAATTVLANHARVRKTNEMYLNAFHSIILAAAKVRIGENANLATSDIHSLSTSELIDLIDQPLV